MHARWHATCLQVPAQVITKHMQSTSKNTMFTNTWWWYSAHRIQGVQYRITVQYSQALKLLALSFIQRVSHHVISSSLRSKLRQCIIQQLGIRPRIRKGFTNWSTQNLFQGVGEVFKPPKLLNTWLSCSLFDSPPMHHPSGISIGASYPKVRCKGPGTAHSELIQPTLSHVGLAI